MGGYMMDRVDGLDVRHETLTALWSSTPATDSSNS